MSQCKVRVKSDVSFSHTVGKQGAPVNFFATYEVLLTPMLIGVKKSTMLGFSSMHVANIETTARATCAGFRDWHTA